MLGCRQLYNDSGLHLESRVIDCPTRTRTLNTKEERGKMMKGGKKARIQNIDGVKNQRYTMQREEQILVVA